ncbi:hypothetical protein OOJ09_30955 [Mesorhizobium qingshengii]|uniref:Uncharacterized protein n=1 Tax=Mesorhizobium qingshengii TaxID=1165689 RepID=A0ABT4R450_9HYPH|nr:hypothetical protein [Mesorhizobium qingshengii]MCZ8548601.1 hypothetical protein [Mesorhizobium qingshengii]
MTDLVDVDELPKTGSSERWRTIALTTIRFGPPIISIVCAIMAGYFTSMTAKPRLPADIAALAVSILKSGDAPVEMRDWAADALGIQTDIAMPAKSIRQ